MKYYKLLSEFVALCIIFFSASGFAFAAAPKYVVVHAWNPGPDNPGYFTGCSTKWMKPILDAIGKRGNGAVQLGLSDVIYALNTDDETIKSCLDNFFDSAEKYDIPFLLSIDAERFWDSRPDLWNWFDAAKPGYNLANIENVEWSGWNTPTRESFINWGSPMKLSPKPCYESQMVRRIIESKFDIIAEKINIWRQKLASERKDYLFLGLEVGWETGIDDYRNASWAVAPYKYQLGYNALSKKGFSAANPPADMNSELAKIIADFNKFRAKIFYDKGIPKDKIFTHSWAADDKSVAGFDGYDQHSPISSAKNDYSTLGISLYPSAYDINRVKAAIGTSPWAIVESPPATILTAPANYLSVKDWLNFGNCKLATVYGLSVSQASTLPQIQQLASLIPANNDPIGYLDGADCYNAGGWACDSDDYGWPLAVNFYADGLAGQGTLIGTTIANTVRESTVAGLCGGNANHGFVFPIPASLKDGKSHTIYAYGINVPSGNNLLLSRPNLSPIPVTIKCGAVQTCVPGTISGCKICKSDGSAWQDDSSKCLSNQTCQVGSCVASRICDANSANGCKICNLSGLGWVDTDSKCAGGQVCRDGACVTLCSPKTCITLGDYECGSWSDGCGKTISCGECAADKICSAGKCVSNCISRVSKKCDSGKLYWYNSCNTKEELAQDCGTDAATFNHQCSGNWTQAETVKKGCAGNVCTSESVWVKDVDCAASGKICSAGVCVAKSTDTTIAADSSTANNSANSSAAANNSNNSSISTAVSNKLVAQMTRAEVVAKINEIVALITKLQAQLKAMGGVVTTKYSCNQINKNLYYGMKKDPQVKCLQEVLKAQGYAVVVSGSYDLSTKNAVTRFQQKYSKEILTPFGLRYGSGNVGNATRNKINYFIK